MTRDRLVPVDVDRLSVRSNFVTNVNAVVPVQIAILDSNVEIREPRRRLDMVWSSLRWHGGLLLRTRSSCWRPIFLEVAVGARIIHKDVHQDG